MEMNYEQELLRCAKEVMVKGGELRFVVIKRCDERIPEIYSYPENKIRCNSEFLTE